tara:strand:- start:9 stop:617 length:609 start_codon:yes stop_codon:yes gene_type:complete
MKTSVTTLANIILANVKGTTIVSVDLDSDLDGKGKMSKKDKETKIANPFLGQGIVKRMTMTGMIGYIYENSVNRLAAKEGQEERIAKPHAWGDLDSKRIFRTHRKNGDVRAMSMKTESYTVHGYFRPDGSELTVDEVADLKNFIPIKKKSSTQADLEGEVIARDIALRNMTAMRFAGTNYSIVNTPEVPQVKTEPETETVNA